MLKHSIALVGLSVLTLSANAAFFDRGDGMIYDNVLNITWLQDANYAATQYTETNGLKGVDGGRMTWVAAKAWADGLIYGGFNDWRLPSVGNTPTTGYNVTTGELGYMYYTNQNNLGFYDPNVACCVIQEGYGFHNINFIDEVSSSTMSFLNVQAGAYGVYWYNERYDDDLVWAFYTGYGDQKEFHEHYTRYSWAVRSGDVHPVPVPAAVWLLGMALLSLAGVKRRHR